MAKMNGCWWRRSFENVTLRIFLGVCLLRHYAVANYEAPEPFQYLHGFTTSYRPPQPASPDPLVQMTWGPDVNASQLQIYRVVAPKSVVVEPTEGAIHGIETLLNEKIPTRLNIMKPSTLQLDWGVERAAWLEFTIKGEVPPSVQISASLSEWNRPYPGKTRTVKKYGNHTYRLETNQELYEGIRFTWIYFEHLEHPIVIDSVCLVAKVKPINYTGSYESSDPELTQAWYTGAYAVRLNMEADGLNTVLIERGDRVAIQGDGHPTIEAALVAFSPFELIANVLNETDSGDHNVVDQSIMSYPLYWCISVLDWFMASGNTDVFMNKLAYDVMKIVNARLADFLDPDLDMVWMGWDDRLGNGWCSHRNHDDCGREAHLTLAGLVLRVTRDLSRVLSLVGMTTEAEHYLTKVNELSIKFKQVREWPDKLGVHAVGNAINANLADETLIGQWMKSVLSDPVTVCSFSPFNQFWILQAFSNAGEMEFALASIKLCWGPQLRLGKGCFWELSSVDFESFMEEGDEAPGLMSYCHPWSSGVTAWQTQVHAGIEPISPGYKKILIAPYVSFRYPSVAATVATPRGPIVLNATLEQGAQWNTVRIHVNTPSPGLLGLSTVSDLDAIRCLGVNKSSDVVLLNGKAVRFGPLVHFDQHLDAFHKHRFNEYRFVEIHRAGSYVLSWTKRACRGVDSNTSLETSNDAEKRFSVPPFPKPDFSGSVTIDTISQGDGLMKYGQDGYLLLGYENGTDRSLLPEYLDKVLLRQHGWGAGWIDTKRTYIGESKVNPSYLPSGNRNQPKNRTRRALGMVGHDGSLGPQVNNSILVDVHLVPEYCGKEYLLSLYCVGGSSIVKQAFRAMDLDTLNPIAPTTMIEMKRETGVWWTLRYDRSVRIRVINIQSLHISAVAVVSSAVFASANISTAIN